MPPPVFLSRIMKPLLSCLLFLLAAAALAFQGAKKPPETFTDAEKAGLEFAVQGEYEGEIAKQKYGLQIVALGDKKFDAFLLAGGLPGAGWDGKTRVKLTGTLNDTPEKAVEFTGNEWKAEAVAGKPWTFKGTSPKGDEFSLKQVLRESAMAGAKPPDGALVLFDGRNVDEWKGGKIVEDKWLGQGATTKKTFNDIKVHVEFRLPFTPGARGQERANSGVYLQQRYEIQILDSFGLEAKKNDCASVYEQTPPSVNMCYPPLSWQTYDIEFKAARYDADGKKTSNAVVTVLHNGVKVHELVEIKGSTGHGKKEENTPGALNLQNHGSPVCFRNVWLVELKD
jgi:hypothetical protein